MGLFVVLLIIPVLLQHISIKSGPVPQERKNRHAMAFFFFFLTVLLMFRHETVGTDTASYVGFFSDIADLSWLKVGKYELEVGFSYLNKLVSVFSKEPQFFLAVTSALCCVLMYRTFKRLCIDPSLTVMLFCMMSTFVMMFSGIRQMLAISMGFVAYEYVRQKRILPFLLTVLLAMSMHTSAFLLLFMYPLFHANITKKWLVAVIPALAILFVFNEPIFSSLGFIIERYTKYDAEISSTGAYTMIILFALFTVFAFVIPDEKKLDRETIGLRNFLLMALALQMFAPLHSLAMRMNYYYIIFIPLLMPKIIEARSHRWKNVAIWGKNVMTAFFFLYFFLTIDGGEKTLNVLPYHFFWEYVA